MSARCICGRPQATAEDMRRLETEGDDSPLVDEISILGGIWQVNTGWAGKICWSVFHPGVQKCTRPPVR